MPWRLEIVIFPQAVRPYISGGNSKVINSLIERDRSVAGGMIGCPLSKFREDFSSMISLGNVPCEIDLLINFVRGVLILLFNCLIK